jgi:hypothetical protein
VHFLLKKDGFVQMHPKEESTDSGETERTVVIKDLDPGQYQLQFLVPNKDRFFEPVETQTIDISNERTVKVQQDIQPVTRKILERKSESKPLYETILGVKPDENTQSIGSLIIAYDTGTHPELIDLVSYQVRDSNGEAKAVPRERDILRDPISSGYLVYYPELTAGNYTVEFYVEDEMYAAKEISIDKGRTQTVRQVVDITTPDAETETEELKVPDCSISVDNNKEKAAFKILQDSERVYSGTGSVASIQLKEYTLYTIEPEELTGFDSTVNPSPEFSLEPGEQLEFQIEYKKQTGNLSVETDAPNGVMIDVSIEPQDSTGTAVSASIESRNGEIAWKSEELPTGQYRVLFETPDQYIPIESEVVEVRHNTSTIITPELVPTRQLTVLSNTSNASYTLRSQFDTSIWNASGRTFTFTGLPPGRYTLTFTSESPDYIAPKEREVLIPENKNVQVRVHFRRKKTT